MARDGWRGVVEGFYGPPYGPADRLAFLEWLGAHGGNVYAYAPKNDPLHRDRWREPYGDEMLSHFAVLADAGRRSGVQLALFVSPALDWDCGRGDGAALAAKLRSFVDAGASVVGVLFDDTTGGGADLGGLHGRIVSAAAEAVGGDVHWATCPVDYATDRETPYLRGLAAALAPGIDVLWTGPSVVTARLTEADVTRFADVVGRRPVLWDNFPVNDGAMGHVLHLGPYPRRDAAAMAATDGVVANLMPLPRASRLGAALALRAWRDPGEDLELAWCDELRCFPGLRPLARACRAWVDDPGADPELCAWAGAFEADGDPRLAEFLAAGCRAGLPSDWVDELEPWLLAWEQAAQLMSFALGAGAVPRGRRPDAVTALGAALRSVPAQERQVFGTRFAVYPVTWCDGRTRHPAAESVVRGESLVDVVLRRVLRRLAEARR